MVGGFQSPVQLASGLHKLVAKTQQLLILAVGVVGNMGCQDLGNMTLK